METLKTRVDKNDNAGMFDPSMFGPEAQQMWEMLDDLARNDPEGYKKFIEKNLTENAPPELMNYETVTPAPGFVCKTVNGTGKKVFFNICGHSKVDKPRPIEGSERSSTGAAPGDQQMRYPMAMGERREDRDKSGSACFVVDVIVNPETIEDAVKNRMTRDLLLEIVFQNYEEKTKDSLCRGHHVSYPNLKYKGDKIQSQNIRKRGVAPGTKPGFMPEKKPEIIAKEVAEEPLLQPAQSRRGLGGASTDTTAAAAAAAAASGNSALGSSKTPVYAMELVRPESGARKLPVAMVFSVELPGLDSFDHGTVDTQHKCFTVDAVPYALRVNLPFIPHASASEAFFARGTSGPSMLRVVIPVQE